MNRFKMIALATAAGLAAAAHGQTTTVQQDFQAAAALDAGTDAAGAVAAWERLEARTRANKRSHAIVLVRQGAALLRVGRRDEAFAATRAGLADLPAGDATLQEDRVSALLNLGMIADVSLDYASAAGFYAEAEEGAAAPVDKVRALLGQIEVQAFVDPDAAMAAAARADAMLATVTADNAVKARLRRAKGRVLLNQGDFAGAKREAMAAVKLLGGLTARTNVDDVSARSDVAVAALLAGDEGAAREYMAMTGAGRLTKGSFDPGAQMKVPDCGGEAELKPADMAVIEFSVGNDGAVSSAVPVYAAGGGDVALEFARVARGWSWTPEQVKELPPFFRYNARVEMRCSTAFERPSIGDLLVGDLDVWLAAKGVVALPEATGPDAKLVADQRRALAAVEAEHGREALAIIPALRVLAANVVVPREEGRALAERGRTILAANDAPATARLVFEAQARMQATQDDWDAEAVTKLLTPLLTTAPYAADPQARAAIRLFIADAERRRSASRARLLLAQVADDSALPANDPLKVGALVRLASLEQEAGDAAAARAAFERSGLDASQCAIIDKPPALIRAGGVFPQEAWQWGFEGWTQAQFDVAADGKVVNERIVLSYPPFIFSKAGKETIAGARYAKSYRPDGGLGCGGTMQRVRFALP